VHRQLIERLDLTKLHLLPVESVQQQIRRIVEDMLVEDGTPLSRQERDQIVVEVQHETFGLGPIEPLMQDPTVNDILVNGPQDIYVERRGKLQKTGAIFRDSAHRCRSSSGSSPPWAGAWTSRPRWSTRGSRTAPA
jgi:pilus assembly protein CpaF